MYQLFPGGPAKIAANIAGLKKPGEKPGRISISFPLPIRFFAWSLRTFGNLIPGLNATGVDEVILALGESAHAETPLFIDVNEGDEGEQVKIYIG